MGGEGELLTHLLHKRYINHLWPLKGRFKPIRMDSIFLRRMKQGVLQFVLIKPLTAIIALLLEWYGIYREGELSLNSGYIYIAFVNNWSVTISLYCLGLFYLATEDRLRPFDPFSKFLCIKAVIFFSYWQACLFAVLMKFNILNDIILVNEA